MQLREVGRIREEVGVFTIQVHEPFRDALLGLEAFDYALVLFWFDQADDARARASLRVAAPYRSGPAELGTFATRAPLRPNPVGVTTTRLLGIDADSGVVRTPFIDALDGTPVLDIKPYVPALDRVRDFEPPAWCAHWPAWAEDAAAFDWASEIRPADTAEPG